MQRFESVAKRPASELEQLLREGRRATAEQLEGFTWHGLALAMPQPLFSLFGRFGKTFCRAEPTADDPRAGRLRGWNVRMRQGEGFTPLTFRKRLVTYGFYDVDLSPEAQLARTYPNAFLIDYGKAGNRAWDPLGRVRDWVTALDDDLLLGRMYLSLGGRMVPTPSYFALARGEPLTEVVQPPLGRG